MTDTLERALPVDEDDFRRRVRAFLEANCPPVDPRWDPPTGVVGVHDPEATHRDAVEYQRALADAGLAGLTVPVPYGGAGLGPEAHTVFAEEAADFAVPSNIPIVVGLSLAIPTLLEHGTEEQRRALIGPTLRAELVWCQLFSEPDAGSDLASLRTTARFVDGEYVVDGQKVWSSNAGHSTHGLLLARSDATGSRHRGLTLFALRMSTPGITVRPLREMTGGNHFSEVFLDDVRVPAEDVIGQPGGGWTAAMSTLGVERRAPAHRAGRSRWERLAELAQSRDASLGAAARHAIADIHVRERALLMLVDRLDGAAAVAGWGAAAGSLAKLGRTQLEQRASLLATQLLGPRSVAWQDDDAAAEGVAHWCLGARASSIAAGTDEVQRNLIGERLLGLPPEPRPPD